MQEQFHLHTLQCLSFLIRCARICIVPAGCLVFWLAEGYGISTTGISWAQLAVWHFCTFLGDTLNGVNFEAIPAVACDPLQEILPQNHQLDLCSKSAVISFPYYPKCLFWLQNPVIPTLPLTRRIFSFSSGDLLECQGCAGPTATIVLTSCDTVSLKSSWN